MFIVCTKSKAGASRIRDVEKRGGITKALNTKPVSFLVSKRKHGLLPIVSSNCHKVQRLARLWPNPISQD